MVKKLSLLFICLLLILSSAGCRKIDSIDEDIRPKTDDVVKWFDCLHGDEMLWDDIRENSLDEYPGVTFRWHYGKLEAVTDKEIVTMYTGMPIWSVYFCDLTGDGKPDLCSSLSIGSGLIDNRIIIYDYANSASYELSDRSNYDYVLNMQDGELVVEKRKCMQEELISSGKLVYQDGTIQIIYDEKNNPEKHKGDEPPSLSYTSIVTYANWTEDSLIFTSALNSKNMMASAARHLPIFKIETKSELEQFEATFGDIFSMAHSYAEVPSFNDVISVYDDSFFADYTLMLCYVSASSGSFRYSVRDIYVEDAKFVMDVVQTNNPEVYTFDMAGWLVIAEVSDSDIKDCTEYDARFAGILGDTEIKQLKQL